MNIHYKQTQFELFPGAHADEAGAKKPKFFLSSVTLTLENIVVSVIIVFVGLILAFASGIEKGKRLALAGTPAVVVEKSVATPAVKAAVKAPDPAPRSLTIDESTPVTVAKTTEDTAVKGAAKDQDNDFYTVQVASFKSRKMADQEAAVLKKKGYQTFVVNKGSLVIVCAGRFPAKKDAHSFSSKLKNKYKDCYARRL